MCARMVWVFDEAKGLWVRKVVFTPEAEWELTGIEEYRLPATYYNVTPTYNAAVLRPGPPVAQDDGHGARRGTHGQDTGRETGAEGARRGVGDERAKGAADAEGGADVLRFERARWGVEGGPGMGHNAKVENLRRSGLWRPLVGKHHCAFVADGFYEWDTSAGRKQPYFIHRRDGQPMLMAGLFAPAPTDGREQPGGGVDDRVRATVVTCPANDLVGTLHDRMPVVLEPKDAQAWIEEKDESLLVPAGDVLAMHPVTADVNKSTNNRPDLIAPVKVAGGVQGKLF